MTLRERIQRLQQERREQHLWRRITAWQPSSQQRLRANGRELINFSANDYLGLAQHPEIVRAFTQAAREHGVGAGASRVVSGSHPLHVTLEEALAEWLGQPRALYFASGYQLNLGLLQALAQRGDRLVCDKLNHASLIDGARLSRAEIRRYPHLDLVAAERQLVGYNGVGFLVSDGVFSMDGDSAALADLSVLARRHHALLVIDDAHGLGVYGDQGRGTFAAQAVVPDAMTLRIGTCGKALGTSGAFVVGDNLWIEHFQQYARNWIYTTAPPPALAAATLAAIRIVREQPQHQQRLHANIAYFRHCMTQAGLPLSNSDHAIQPFIVGGSQRAVALSQHLAQHGLLVAAVREPTVPRGSARLRISLSALHQQCDIERLVEVLHQADRALSAVTDDEVEVYCD